jgi:hypothetical protein
MPASSNQTTAAAVAANDRTGRPATPRIRLRRRSISIDHPDRDVGERLLADALGAVDRDAMHGLLQQLVRASVIGQKPDAANLAFMISMMKSIAPRDSIEAMLAAQMVAVQVTAMRCACRLAAAGSLPQQDSAVRAFGRLARTFPAQLEALSRYRSNGDRAITVQSVAAQDDARAIADDAMPATAIVAELRPVDAAIDAADERVEAKLGAAP